MIGRVAPTFRPCPKLRGWVATERRQRLCDDVALGSHSSPSTDGRLFHHTVVWAVWPLKIRIIVFAARARTRAAGKAAGPKGRPCATGVDPVVATVNSFLELTVGPLSKEKPTVTRAVTVAAR